MTATVASLVRSGLVAAGVLAVAAPPWLALQDAARERVIHEAMHHLGDEPQPTWSEASAQPEPSPLVIRFESDANADEWTLEAQARDVDDDWTVELNGRRLGLLRRKGREPLQATRFVVPAGLLVAGENALTVRGRNPKEDITVGRFKLIESSLRDLLALGRIDVTVRDAADGSPLPARITVVDAAGALVELHYAAARTTAVRAGIAYTAGGTASIELPPGHYAVWASRGMEWSAEHSAVEVTTGATRSLAFALTREVDTTGWIAADTHVHTLTYSGHGDSSVEERVVTLAGEGVELAVATDHNHQTDYRPLQQELELTPWFTPVTGNEVTSDNGHMNAFPLPPGTDVPPWKEKDWEKLVAGIRAKGAQVVILNHPRWPENGKDPLTVFGFDERSGERRVAQRFTFDCLELVNSDGPTQPPSIVLPGWYALLNRGERFTGVGASDSHHVGVIVGQGRTYVPSATDDPARIDVADACRQFKEGRVTVSLGMLATIEIAGRGMGETVPAPIAGAGAGDGPAGELEALVVVRHPSWVTPERLDLMVDGAVVATTSLAPSPADEPRVDSRNEKVRRLRFALPPHDAWVVAVASGAKVTAPFGAMSQPCTLAVTNPVFVDRDGEPGWQSPRATAERIFAAARANTDGSNGGSNGSPARLTDLLPALLAGVDDAVAIQALELARGEMEHAELETIAASLGSGRATLRDWVKSQPPPR